MCLIGSEQITELKIALSFLALVLKSRWYAHSFFKAVNSASLDTQAGTAICLQGTRSWLPRARETPLIETRLTVLFNFSFVNVCNGAASQRAPGAPDYSTSGRFVPEALKKPDFKVPVPQSAVPPT